MKKIIVLNIYVLSLILILVGCSNKEKQNTPIEIWHYYNGTQKIAFDQLVMEFNETLGLEKGIIVEAFSQGNISQLEEKIIESVEKKVGASPVPDVVTTYPEAAYTLDQLGIVANLEDYITDKEIDEYVGSYIEEGHLGSDNQLKIFPTVKSTEIMMVNKTDWDQFAQATGVGTKDLETWEGIRSTAKLYYNWTDSLTESPNDGRAFFGRDALANYILVGAKQLGQEIFQVKEEKVTLNIDHDTMRKLWDNYYIPYISGYYTSFGRFSSDDAKIGEIIALVGSTTGAAYFPDKVTMGDNESYNIEVMMLPLPNFENTELHAVQQGAGMVVLKSGKDHEKASVEFLKWFTQESRNLEFAIKTGCLPVKKSAYNIMDIENELQEKNIHEGSKQLQLSFPVAMDQMKRYNLHINKGFENGGKAREVLGRAMEHQSKEDRKKVIELIEQGATHEEAVGKFSSDEHFSKWLAEFEKDLTGALKI